MIDELRPPPLYVVAEVARIAALRSYHVLDAAIVPGLAGLTEAAASCMGRPMAAVSFVDSDRLQFGAAFGMPCRETPRQGSFCERAIAQSGPFVVQNALVDERFRHHPDVCSDWGIRFYAGISLEDEDGYRLGTLCVFDSEPGSAHPVALTELARLAALTMRTLSIYRDAMAGPQPGPIQLRPDRVQGWLGLRTRASSPVKGNSKPGLIILSVARGGPADRAGLRPTDILLSIDGQMLQHANDVVTALAKRPADGFAQLTVIRAGQKLERIVPIEAEPAKTWSIRAPMALPAYGIGALP